MLVAISLGAQSPGGAAGYRGDSVAVAAAERLLAHVGGREQWRRRTLVVEERGYFRSGESALLRISRDFTTRSRLIERQGESGRFLEWVSPTGGWTEQGGVRTPMPAAELGAERVGLRQEPYDIYHRLALRDPGLRVELRANGTQLMVYDAEERNLAWFVLDGRGAIASWGNFYDGAINQHHYGPLIEFGPLRFPKFGAAYDGRFRFEYLGAQMRDEPVNEPSRAR